MKSILTASARAERLGRRWARFVCTVTLAFALVTAGVAGAPFAAQAASPPTHVAGTTESHAFTSVFGTNSYLVYTPKGYVAGTPLPVVVMIHGCASDAAQQQKANLIDPVADAANFIVVYPDNDGSARADTFGVPSTHPVQCWRWYDPASNLRGSGDVYQLAQITKAVTRSWTADATRVYALGMSSGGMITSSLGATYPDLYAAIGIVAGCPYASTIGCLLNPYWSKIENPTVEAQAAHRAQGSRARSLPVLSIQGDSDKTIDPGESANVIAQWLQTGALATNKAPILAPSAVRQDKVPGGYSYQVEKYTDNAGCATAERWTIFGMDHFWPGGSADPGSSIYSDPAGPSGATAAWNFFSQFRLGQPC